MDQLECSLEGLQCISFGIYSLLARYLGVVLYSHIGKGWSALNRLIPFHFGENTCGKLNHLS